jgi:hypothetical protein
MTIARDNELRLTYARSTNIPSAFVPVKLDEYVPLVTDGDYARGFITRYFVRSANNVATSEIIEVDEGTYNSLYTNNFYVVTSMYWTIRGTVDTTIGLTIDDQPIILQYGVVDANQRAVDIAEQSMPGIKHAVTNLTRFYQGL